jgi:hypothetical protein
MIDAEPSWSGGNQPEKIMMYLTLGKYRKSSSQSKNAGALVMAAGLVI